MRLPVPVGARTAARSLVGSALQRALPFDRLLRARTASVRELPPVVLALVYRSRNAATVHALLEGAGLPLTVALWALDEVAPQLAAQTVGCGPGGRFALLERAVSASGAGAGSWLVLADDDVHLSRGSLADLVRAALFVGFDVTQPAHGKGSTHFWALNRHRPLTYARSTRFVETGPLLLMSPRARAACLPLPPEFAMGIGSEAVWGGRPELRTGVVDAVTMVHTGTVGGAYDAPAEWDRTAPTVRSLLRDVGAETVQDLQRVDGAWRLWQQRPPWRNAPE